MEAKLDIITADEARALMEKDPARVARLNDFFEEVRAAATRNESSMQYDEKEHLGDLTDAEKNYLRSLGYSISWNRPLQHYDVSWEVA